MDIAKGKAPLELTHYLQLMSMNIKTQRRPLLSLIYTCKIRNNSSKIDTNASTDDGIRRDGGGDGKAYVLA